MSIVLAIAEGVAGVAAGFCASEWLARRRARKVDPPREQFVVASLPSQGPDWTPPNYTRADAVEVTASAPPPKQPCRKCSGLGCILCDGVSGPVRSGK